MKSLHQVSDKPLRDLLAARTARYLALYAKALPILVILILLNCQFTVGRFVFTWNAESWYLVICYLAFPWVHVLFNHLLVRRTNANHPTDQPKAVAPKAKTYAAGLPMTPIQDFSGSEDHLLPRLLRALVEFTFAPIILLILPVMLGFRHGHRRHQLNG
ncbi:hypothetical protein [Levilactobacillus tongjiangensis]|uniref:Uncharacterized protein n=1 Tax=Levilactobacillus tongjiangensis TaxID=2486023 RepID=A0ABW1SSM6_9LACO|nr:hypothetical protein [Levilactobacillus tongjiangensis]